MKNRNLRDSFRNAFDGIRNTAANERNFKIHIILAVFAVIFCIVFRVGTVLFIWVAFSIFAVLITELINTAVEALTDLVCGGKSHPLAKIAKDAAAAAVLLAAAQAVITAAAVAFSVISGLLK